VAARQEGVEGSVVLLLHVGPDGGVLEVRVVSSSGDARLDRAARDTAATWRFRPGIKGGRAVSTWVSKTISFRLED
jgi:protein TonB